MHFFWLKSTYSICFGGGTHVLRQKKAIKELLHSMFWIFFSINPRPAEPCFIIFFENNVDPDQMASNEAI